MTFFCAFCGNGFKGDSRFVTETLTVSGHVGTYNWSACGACYAARNWEKHPEVRWVGYVAYRSFRLQQEWQLFRGPLCIGSVRGTSARSYLWARKGRRKHYYAERMRDSVEWLLSVTRETP
jgi:hypothetical protein